MSVLELENKEFLALPNFTFVETARELRGRHPLDPESFEAIVQHRSEIEAILNGQDDRLLIIVGPCSLDGKKLEDGKRAVEVFAAQILLLSQDPFVESKAKVVMRCPPAKPRTDIGMAGMEQEDLDQAHEILTNIANSGVALASEIMIEKHFARYGDMLSLGWIGARDGKSTLLRHAVAAHPELPILFKNGEDGKLTSALSGIKTASAPHIVELTDPDNRQIRVRGPGNHKMGIILRGGAAIKTPKDFEVIVEEADGVSAPFIVDLNHDIAKVHDPDGKKSVQGQLGSAQHLLEMLSRQTFLNFRGVMIESHLLAGANPAIAGMSNTDPCISIDNAIEVIYNIVKLRST